MAATPEQKHAAEALIRIRRVGNMYAGALDPPGRLLADGALVGPAGDRLSEALLDRYRTMRSAVSTAFDQARHMAGPEGLGAAEPYLGTAPRTSPRPGAEIRSGDPGLIDSLISELTDAGLAWENAGRELSAILDGLGLSTSPGDSLRRAGIWIAHESDDLRQRQLLLRASVPTPAAVNNTYKVTNAGWRPGGGGSGGFWGFLDDAAKGIDMVEDVASAGWDQFTDHFLPGLLDGTAALGKFAATNNPYTAIPYAITDFDGWLQQTPVGLIEALYQNRNHPLDFAKAAVNWDMWANDPIRALGEAIPTLLLTVATGGAGATSLLAKADAGAIAAAERTITANAAKEAANSKGIVKTPPTDKKVAGTPPDKPVAGGSKDVPVAGAGQEPGPSGGGPSVPAPPTGAVPLSSKVWEYFATNGAAGVGKLIGLESRSVPKGSKTSHVLERLAELKGKASQEQIANVADAAATWTWGETAGWLKLPNGEIVVLPKHDFVKDVLVVSRDGTVHSRKADRVIVDGKITVKFID